MLQARGEDDAAEAASLFERALTKDPHCVAAFWELGWALQLLGEYDRALAAWDEVRRLAPDHPELDRHYPVLSMRRDQARWLAALPDPGARPPPEEEPRPGPTVTVSAVGDVQMGRAWPETSAALPPDDGAPLFTHVAASLQHADLAFGNLETVLADTGDSTKCGRSSKVCYAFRVPTSFAKTLAAAGFDVMSTANNHAGDFGAAGRASTLAALDAVGIHHSGPVGDIASFEVKGLRIALIAFATGAEMHRLQDIETARRLVAEADRSHDLVLVSFHGGAEGAKATRVLQARERFYGEDRGDVYAFAHAVVDAGADLVLGHGPHVLRAMEIYRGRLIAYSLGNFSAWKSFNLEGSLGISAVLEVTLALNGVAVRARLLPLALEDPGVPVPDPKARAIDIVNDLSVADLGRALFDANGLYERAASTSSPALSAAGHEPAPEPPKRPDPPLREATPR